MPALHGALVAFAAFVVLTLLMATLGSVGPLELALITSVAVVAGLVTARRRRPRRTGG